MFLLLVARTFLEYSAAFACSLQSVEPLAPEQLAGYLGGEFVDSIYGELDISTPEDGALLILKDNSGKLFAIYEAGVEPEFINKLVVGSEDKEENYIAVKQSCLSPVAKGSELSNDLILILRDANYGQAQLYKR